MRHRLDPTARWRGAAAGLLTAGLAVGAHTLAAGAAPRGAAVVLLAVLAATVGAAASARTMPGPCLVGLLAVGQLAGHGVLAVAGHSHNAPSLTPAMVCLHVIAVVAGAALITAADRLLRSLSLAAKGFAVAPAPPHPPAAVHMSTSDQPWQWMLMLVTSVSHRGPPVSGLPR